MKVTIFQKAANAIKSWVTPKWLKDLLGVVEVKLIKLGEEIVLAIRNSVIFAAEHPEWNNDEKFGYVYRTIKNKWKYVGENILGITIKSMVASLKDKGHI